MSCVYPRFADLAYYVLWLQGSENKMASGVQKLVNKVKSGAREFADSLTPTLKESKFKETGMITAEEFVIAGDHLIYHCPTWSWSSGDPSKHKLFLPPNKQFLLTKKVPCYRRCYQMAVIPENEKVIKLNGDDDEGWVDTHHGVAIEQMQDKVMEMTLEVDEKKQKVPKSPLSPVAFPLVGSGTAMDDNTDSDSDGPVEDIDDYEFEEDDDPAALKKEPTPKKQSKSEEIGILATRTYDLNITYDNFYRTPRLWLFGYSESQRPLSEKEVFEDISQDHLNKTVTMENHPHFPPPPRLSVHPCRHAEVMKKIMTMIEDDGRELEVHSYMLVFLKFVQAVIPTIEYDYTQQLAITSA